MGSLEKKEICRKILRPELGLICQIRYQQPRAELMSHVLLFPVSGVKVQHCLMMKLTLNTGFTLLKAFKNCKNTTKIGISQEPYFWQTGRKIWPGVDNTRSTSSSTSCVSAILQAVVTSL
jgi:hypothetical protein